MLQKLEKGSYNKLSRRQVLKALGVMFAVGELTGCTSLLGPNSKSNSSYDAKQLALSKEDRLVKAFAKIDKRFLKQSFQQIKEIQRSYTKGKIDAQLALKNLRQITEQVFVHYDAIGLIGAIDETFSVRSILETQTEFNPALIQAIMDEGRFTQEEFQQIRGLYQEAREKLLPIASELTLRKLMARIVNKLRQLEETAYSLNAVPPLRLEPMMPQALVCAHAVISASGWGGIVAIACFSCSIPGPDAIIDCTACAIALVMFTSAEEVVLEVC
jgi:hypothetical protein